MLSYFIEKEFLNLSPEFQKARNVRFPFGTCLGTHATDDSQGKIIEVILNDQSAVDNAVTTPILVHLSKLPFLPVANLHATLVDNFSRYGNKKSIDPTNPRAWDKLTRGHLARHCPRSHDNSIASSKKRVRNEEQPFVPSIDKVLTNLVPTTDIDNNVTATGNEPNNTAVNSVTEEARILRSSNSITALSDNGSMMDVSEDDNNRLTDAEELPFTTNNPPAISEDRSTITTSAPKNTSSKVATSAITTKRVSPRANKNVAAIKYDPSSSSPTASFRKTSA
ncbi:hypothetical protein INT47_007398 [Mucor saturninus]|uniref:Uncharacterized protein n=1 Tax=Mucor saturninus TaxID=64648 RepID=A0A8H7US64_9FUNG|nr:hypothetical protein INT47_007398 [Mucor saturninus]